jgi:hypothetical protein
MKQFATWFTHGVPGGAKLRSTIYQARNGEGVLAEVERFFEAQMTGTVNADADAEPVDLLLSQAELICD